MVDVSGGEFCNYLEQIGKRIGATDIDYKDESIEIPDERVEHFERWISLFLENSDLLPYEPYEQSALDRLRGVAFWVSLRLSLHYSKYGKGSPEERRFWKKLEYQRAGQNIAFQNHMVNPAATERHIGKAYRLELAKPNSQGENGGDSRAWQISFKQVCKQKEVGLVNVGEYVQATLERDEGEEGVLVQRGDSVDGRIIELRCQENSNAKLDFPLTCTVLVTDRSIRGGGVVIWGKVILDDNKMPILGREVPEAVIEGAESFISHLEREIISNTGKLLTSEACNDFWKAHYSSYWKDFADSESELKEMLRWITSYDEKSHLGGLAKYSQSFGDLPTIFRGARGMMGTSKLVVMKAESQHVPNYFKGRGTTADFIFKEVNKQSAFLPKMPLYLALIIGEISGPRFRSQALTFKGLGRQIAKQYGTLLIDGGLVNNSFEVHNLCNTLAHRLYYYDPRTKTKYKRRGKIEDIIQWGAMPENPTTLCEQLRHSYRSTIEHKQRWESNKLPDNWIETLDDYFDEVEDWIKQIIKTKTTQ